MAFKCLIHAHTILVGLVLSWKEDTGETLTRSGSSYWQFQISSGKNLVDQLGTHPTLTKGTGFKIETWLQEAYPMNSVGDHYQEQVSAIE